MNNIKYLIITSILIGLLISCNSDDNNTQLSKPKVFTLNPIVETNGGLRLLGNYLSNGYSISEAGFEYSLDSLFNNRIMLTAELHSNEEIEYLLENEIENNVTYFYKAFVKSSGETFFGNTKSFVSDGRSGPEIDSISNDFGYIGDTLSIYGKYFKDNNHQTYVDFSGVNGPVIFLNDSIIKCKVPANINNIINDVRVRIDNRVDSYSSFTLHEPEINAISPLNATFRDELTITGNNFDVDTSKNKVYFGTIQATITYADRNTLIVIVPDNLQSSTEPIKVVTQLQEVVFDDNFQLIPPEISFIPEYVNASQDISIQGAYFHPILNSNIITIEEIEVNLTSGNTSILDTQIPQGPFPRRKAIVKIELLDLIVEYEIELNIIDKWVMISDNLPFRFYRSINNAVVANNKAFVIAKSLDIYDDTYYLWELDPSNFSWEQSTIPFTMKWSAVAVSNNNKIFVYNAESDNGFWEFDPVIEQWNQKTSFPGARRDHPSHFSINGDIYIGIGADIEPYTSITYGDFYKYSPMTDNWSQIADFDYQNYFIRLETSTFTINNIAYVGNGATNTGMVDFWSYHPNTDEWIRIADFNDSRNYTGSFELNGFGYVTGGNPTGWSSTKDCWRYEPLLNSWKQIEDIGPIERSGHFAFSLNGKGYIGGGTIYGSGGTNGYEFYEFVP